MLKFVDFHAFVGKKKLPPTMKKAKKIEIKKIKLRIKRIKNLTKIVIRKPSFR